MPPLKFKTTLEPRGPAAAVILSDAQVEKVGEGKKTFPVKATVNGYTWAGRVARMGGENLLGLNKAIRTAAGVEAGDKVDVVVELDSGERTVDVPEALAAALKKDKKAGKEYDALAYSHRKEFARWVGEAKKEETRDRRVEQAIEMLHAGKTR
jgi:bifunctional DNA-binding transcriptional regulator/antitoxin component of YhaV-PrlF toxin-antitoxin module